MSDRREAPSQKLAEVLGVDPAAAQAVYADIQAKRRTTAYQHMAPVILDSVLNLSNGAGSEDQ